MVTEYFEYSSIFDDEDLDDEDLDDEYQQEERLLRMAPSLKKGEDETRRMGKNSFVDPKKGKKNHKNDAKNRYLRKHRDEVQW